MCATCGHPTKPACDQDPDCPHHCCGDEHLETLDRALDEFVIAWWDDREKWRAMVAEAARAATPSHMNAADDQVAELEWGTRRRRGTPSAGAERF